MNKNNSISINQTLHGYSNGHTLLASSSELNSETKRVMLPISDMSGSSMISGFETYITGYSLKEANCYAIAKTWYAPEMKRPGCVWTHTLLIDFEDIPRLNNIEYILSLFKRPSESQTLDNFKIKIDYLPLDNFDSNKIEKRIESEYYHDLLKTVLHALYTDSNSKILIKRSLVDIPEIMFLSIWRQQWPRLRRNFSFCTGAISPRTLGGELLELQVIPTKLDISSNESDDIITIGLDDIGRFDDTKWLQLAYENTFSQNSSLQNFHNFFGSDLNNGRIDFKTLTETYVYFRDNNPDLPSALEFVANLYKNKAEGTSLKLSLFGNLKSGFPQLLPSYSEKGFIFHFATTEFFKSFDYQKLNFDNRFTHFFIEHDSSSLNLLNELINHDLNVFGESAILKLATSPDFFENDMIWANRNLTHLFISINPSLAYNKQIWLLNKNEQIEIIHAIQTSENQNINWKVIIPNLIDINSDIDPKIFADDELIIGLVLDWINKENSAELGLNWLHFLTTNDIACLEWLNNQQNCKKIVMEILVTVLNPNSKVVINHGANPWNHFILTNGISGMSKDFYCFVLALALNLKSKNSQILFEVSFEMVYNLVLNENLTYHLWRYLEVHTKPLSIFKNWDKSKKLLNAVVDHYLKNSWEIKRFVNQLNDRNLSEKLISQYKKRK